MTTRASVEAAWRTEAPRLIGGLVRIVRDLDLAEDLAQEALLAALEKWPETGIPDNPGAWLMATAKNRAIDRARRQRTRDDHAAQAAPPSAFVPDPETAIDEDVGDDLLRLILVACHPVLSRDARVALTLRLLGGLSTAEIARAFLTPDATIAQRIVRAKRTIAEARVPFEVPRGEALAERIPAVLEVVYLIYNEGYAASRGDDWMRLELCDDAMRLGRVLCRLVPDHAEAHGLLALMELQSSRARARTTPTGEPILLLDQDRSRWDQLLIQRGFAAFARAAELAKPLGPYTLQAAIAALHARARRAEDTDWNRIVALYDALVALTGSPVVELNRAVAVWMAYGAAQALDLVDELRDEPALKGYHLLHAVRGQLLDRLARHAEAAEEHERAAALAGNERERTLLEARARTSRLLEKTGG
ncbi:MAG: sigma-70 family RNA polymerase sigma factor [Deltaproteobacteria bacterium]|nr:sigma-70 family RNA polymerase sigma factor [Deltaproteobacteria bacterium]